MDVEPGIDAIKKPGEHRFAFSSTRTYVKFGKNNQEGNPKPVVYSFESASIRDRCINAARHARGDLCRTGMVKLHGFPQPRPEIYCWVSLPTASFCDECRRNADYESTLLRGDVVDVVLPVPSHWVNRDTELETPTREEAYMPVAVDTKPMPLPNVEETKWLDNYDLPKEAINGEDHTLREWMEIFELNNDDDSWSRFY